MRRKALAGLATNLAQMLPATFSPRDLETLVSLPNGELEIDILGSRATRNSLALSDLDVTAALLTWLKTNLAQLDIPLPAITCASVAAHYRTDRVPTNREKLVLLDWKCQGRIATLEREYTGNVVFGDQWYTRRPPNQRLERP